MKVIFLLTLMLFQTCISFILWWNIKKIFHTIEVNDYHNFVASNIEQTAPLVANQSLICHT